jgi:hypothetical protein
VHDWLIEQRQHQKYGRCWLIDRADHRRRLAPVLPDLLLGDLFRGDAGVGEAGPDGKVEVESVAQPYELPLTAAELPRWLDETADLIALLRLRVC